MTRACCLLLACTVLSGCKVGPDYVRPNAAVPLAYRELPEPPAGWALARPDDGAARGAWWTMFGDPALDVLAARVAVDNQTIRAAEAAYRNAQALVREARAGLYPTISGTGGVTRARQDRFSSTSGQAELSASWEIDVWGRIRRSIESSAANAQASAADLANARLSAQASLATLYFQLAYQDELTRLLQQTVAAYRRALTITTNQAQFGVAAPSDVLTARTQLDSAQSQLVNAGLARAEYEHAIAALIGAPPTDLALPPAPLPDHPPVVPVALPSVLLQRRPDIAAAERTMQAQNAQIGVAVAAYYPAISLSGLFGYSGSPLSMLFNVSRQLWSLGASASDAIFEGGLRPAQVAAARASYDQSVANYRQTVLTAFQGVEDQLSGLRILGEQAAVQARATADAQRAVAIALNEYEAGTQNYTTVVTAQATLLADQQTALQIRLDRLLDVVDLVQALGGGWDAGGVIGRSRMAPGLHAGCGSTALTNGLAAYGGFAMPGACRLG